jgi:ketosteroid isomerase-like protein
MNTPQAYLGLASLTLAACSPPGATPDYAAQLREADIDFAAETVARGNDGWAEYFMPDGMMFPRSGKVQGREEIRTAMAEAFLPGTRLDWEPEQAVASQSGDLGYTIGRWQSIVVTEDGRDSVTASGNYVSIWRRDANGEWRVAADIGNTDEPLNGGSE